MNTGAQGSCPGQLHMASSIFWPGTRNLGSQIPVPTVGFLSSPNILNTALSSKMRIRLSTSDCHGDKLGNFGGYKCHVFCPKHRTALIHVGQFFRKWEILNVDVMMRINESPKKWRNTTSGSWECSNFVRFLNEDLYIQAVGL